MARAQTAEIQQFILDTVESNPADIAAVTARRFGITRQAAHRHIAELVRQGHLSAEGQTKSRRYKPATRQRAARYEVTPKLEEHVVWDDVAAPILGDLPKNIAGICSYGFTEMVNNVIDHSESEVLSTEVIRKPNLVSIEIYDRGVGIFNKIQRDCRLESARDAILQLTKGKFTTDPSRHTGEGIFFTSRMFDSFSILSGALYLAHKRDDRDWLLEDRSDKSQGGTLVLLKIDPASIHTAQEVFDHYQSARDDYAFNKTTVSLQFAGGEKEPLVSRSQARRVTANLDRFKEVVLDFSKVEMIGPAFADEVFRVFARGHPDVQLLPVNTNEGVDRMIRKAVADSESG